MRYTLLTLLPIVMMAKVHYAKVEPYDSLILKSAVSAQVERVDLQAEGKMILNAEVIHLDDQLDKVDLNISLKSLELLHNILDINQEMLESLSDTLKRQKSYFERLNKLSTASKTQKDTAFNTFVSAKNQYLSTKEKIETLTKQILDMEYRVAQLKDSITKKSIRLDEQYLYKLLVRKGDFVNPSSPLAAIQNQTKGKLTLYLEPDELKNIEKKKVYIDDKETSYKVDKVWRVADEKFISSYRAEIYTQRPKGQFSQLVKVELR